MHLSGKWGPDTGWISPPLYGYRKWGVPWGGPFDRESATLAIAWIGLPTEYPILEIGPFGASITADSPTQIAIVGAERTIHHNGTSISSNVKLSLAPNDQLHIGPATQGARSYLAAKARSSPINSVVLAEPPSSVTNISETLHILPGPDAERGFESLAAQTWTVANESNRLGLRLSGVAIDIPTLNRPSQPQIPGVIQLPPSGQPIILGPDGPTLGGYPQLGVITNAHLDRLAQLNPGDSFRFNIVDRPRAMHLAEERHIRISRLVKLLNLTQS